MFPKNSNFVVVDDSTAIRAMIKDHLSKLGMNTIGEGANGVEALRVMEELHKSGKKIDLAIIDWKMPEMDGYHLLKHLKENKDFQKIPVLMIAAENELEKIVLAFSAGATEFLRKPFDSDQLAEKLEIVYNSSQFKVKETN